METIWRRGVWGLLIELVTLTAIEEWPYMLRVKVVKSYKEVIKNPTTVWVLYCKAKWLSLAQFLLRTSQAHSPFPKCCVEQ